MIIYLNSRVQGNRTLYAEARAYNYKLLLLNCWFRFFFLAGKSRRGTDEGVTPRLLRMSLHGVHEGRSPMKIRPRPSGWHRRRSPRLTRKVRRPTVRSKLGLGKFTCTRR